MVQVFPGYSATLGIPVLYGRDFARVDMVAGAPYVAVINETLARQVFPNKNPLGRQFEFGHSLCQVIGVVKDAKYGNLRGTAPGIVYQPFSQASTGRGQMVLHVRVSGKTDGVVAQVKREIQAVDQNLPAFRVQTLASELNAELGQERLIATLSVVFGLLALALVSIGLYGIMAYSVTRRTSEIGIRMALGAECRLVLRIILGDAMRLTAIGVATGLVGGLVLTRFIVGILYGVRPWICSRSWVGLPRLRLQP
jgi:ABC-type antimicrobial peptide transport system permease subunit